MPQVAEESRKALKGVVEQMTEVPKIQIKDQALQHTRDQILDVLGPHSWEKCRRWCLTADRRHARFQTKGMPQECVSERMFEQLVDIPASQIQEQIGEVMQFIPKQQIVSLRG